MPDLCPPCPRRPPSLPLLCSGGPVPEGTQQPHRGPETQPSPAMGLCHKKRSHPEWAQRPKCLTEHRDPLPLSGAGPGAPRAAGGDWPSPHGPARTHLGRAAPGDPPLNAQSAGTSPLCLQSTRGSGGPAGGALRPARPGPQGPPPRHQQPWGTSSVPLIPASKSRRTQRDPGLQGSAASRAAGPRLPPAGGATPGAGQGPEPLFQLPQPDHAASVPAQGVEGPRAQPARLGAGRQPRGRDTARPASTLAPTGRWH